MKILLSLPETASFRNGFSAGLRQGSRVAPNMSMGVLCGISSFRKMGFFDTRDGTVSIHRTSMEKP